MATKKTAPARGKTATRSTDETALAVAMNGEYNTIISLNSGLNAYVRHPLNGRIIHCDTKSQKFIDVLGELRGIGLGDRIDREIAAMAKDSATWTAVQSFLAAASSPAVEEAVVVEA